MWRPIKREDIRPGLAVNAFGKDDTSPYSVSTIMCIRDESRFQGNVVPSEATRNYNKQVGGFVTLARPMAFASPHGFGFQPMLHAELYEVTVERLLEVGIVWEDRDNLAARTYTT